MRHGKTFSAESTSPRRLVSYYHLVWFRARGGKKVRGESARLSRGASASASAREMKVTRVLYESSVRKCSAAFNVIYRGYPSGGRAGGWEEEEEEEEQRTPTCIVIFDYSIEDPFQYRQLVSHDGSRKPNAVRSSPVVSIPIRSRSHFHTRVYVATRPVQHWITNTRGGGGGGGDDGSGDG